MIGLVTGHPCPSRYPSHRYKAETLSAAQIPTKPQPAAPRRSFYKLLDCIKVQKMSVTTTAGPDGVTPLWSIPATLSKQAETQVFVWAE